MFTLSNLATLLVSFTLVVKAAPGDGLTPRAGPVFAVYPGWDMDNGSSGGVILNGTEQACLQACSNKPPCAAYAYVPYGSPFTGAGPGCVLKNEIDTGTFKIQPYDVSVGLLGPCGTFKPPVGPTSCFTVTPPK